MGILTGILTHCSVVEIHNQKTLSEADKNRILFMLLNQWLRIKQEGKNLSDFFVANKYKSIAIYGMSYVGARLVAELKNTDVVVKYGIDKNAGGIYSDIDVITLEDELPDVDVIVVTSITYFNEVKEELKKKINYPIISLQEVLDKI